MGTNHLGNDCKATCVLRLCVQALRAYNELLPFPSPFPINRIRVGFSVLLERICGGGKLGFNSARLCW